ncbi:hypothetical protein AB0467_01450 [Streptomyces sp. NPDC052095]|uniref:hypothetical protein n=1 Tax=unclassified Streptomyces TaxID=2593676 RepID=UPI00344DA7A7
MSTGLALPSITEVLPAVDFAPAAQPVGGLLAHPDVAHVPGVADAVHTVGGHVTDAVSHGLHELIAPATAVLGSLSGVLLAGRAALVTTQVLAAAAVRAADEQACLVRRQEVSATAARQWEAAAFAAVRANARRAALLARVGRAARAASPDRPPPPRPGLPGPLAPTGMSLPRLREELAVLERRTCEAEAAHADWVLRTGRNVFAGPADDLWQRELPERRAEAAARSRTPDTAQDEALPMPPPADDLRHEDVVRLGAELLARLDPAATATDTAPADAAVRHAIAAATARPLKARTHLREARRFVTDVNRAVRARRDAEERAAAQLQFLETAAPEGTAPLSPAPAETALLRRVLDEGHRLEPDEQRQVDERVAERLADLELRYVEQVLRSAGTAVDRTSRTDPAGHADGRVRFDWTPPGWGDEHWLRIVLEGGQARVATMHDERPGGRYATARALDDERCHEAAEHLDELRALLRRHDIDLDFAYEESGTLPGTRGEEDVLVLTLPDDAAHPSPAAPRQRRDEVRTGHRTARTPD